MKKFLLDESVFDNIGCLGKADNVLFYPGGRHEIEMINGKKHIVLKLNTIVSSKLEDACIENGDKNIMLSLISTVEEPSIWDWLALEDYFSEAKIKRWCAKYGLPEIEEEIKDKFCFPLQSFCMNAATLFLTFQLWRAIEFDDLEGINRYSAILFEHPELLKAFGTPRLASTSPLERRKATFYKDNSLEHRKEVSLSFLPWSINLNNIRLCFSSLKTFYFDAESIFDLCNFHLASMIAKGEAKGRNIKRCKACGDLFTGHGNRKHCQNCDRRTEYSRRKKKRGKLKVKAFLFSFL